MTALRRMRSERGFTLIEVLVAMLLLVVGILATLGAMASAHRLTGGVQRDQQALGFAQREAERVSALSWASLALDAAPASAASPADMPPAFVSGSNFLVKKDFNDPAAGPPAGVPSTGEPLVIAAGGGAQATPQTVTVGDTTGKLYEYVTQGSCGTLGGTELCGSSLPVRRVIVAVVLDPTQNGEGGLQRPVWVSTLVAQRPTESP